MTNTRSNNSSRQIQSNQSGVHERLVETVHKHLKHRFLKPIAEHTLLAYEQLKLRLDKDKRPLILDSCCGVGDSSRFLAHQHPEHLVIGVDKSASRLTREREVNDLENLLLIRADLNDFYRLMEADNVRLAWHYILYPNPWPKSAHLKRRWHGAPIFPSMIALGGGLIMRSNWPIYLEEFNVALQLAGINGHLARYNPDLFMTPFEKKYHQSGQSLWQLTAQLGIKD